MTKFGQTGPLTYFKACDVRGELGVNFDAAIVYRIGRAVAQHFGSGTVVIGRDARETSPELAKAVARGNAGGFEERIAELSSVIVG